MKLQKIRNNLTKLETKEYTIFFSYETPIGLINQDYRIVTDEYFSRTTSKQMNILKSEYLLHSYPSNLFEKLLIELGVI